jgi:hypothetical protein
MSEDAAAAEVEPDGECLDDIVDGEEAEAPEGENPDYASEQEAVQEEGPEEHYERKAVGLLVHNDADDYEDLLVYVEFKGKSYPIEVYQDTVTLPGGSIEDEDADYLDGLLRELDEELDPEVVAIIKSHINKTPYTGVHAAVPGKPVYHEVVYECIVEDDEDWEVLEEYNKNKDGSTMMVLEGDEIEDEEYAWGADLVIEKLLKEYDKNIELDAPDYGEIYITQPLEQKLGHVNHAAGITPLVVVPANNLNKSAAYDFSQGAVKYAA